MSVSEPRRTATAARFSDVRNWGGCGTRSRRITALFVATTVATGSGWVCETQKMRRNRRSLILVPQWVADPLNGAVLQFAQPEKFMQLVALPG